MKRLILVMTALLGCSPAVADCLLQSDTAASDFALGPFLDETDGITPETALTITSAEVLLKKKGSTSFSAKNEASSCTHRSNGWYTCPLDTTDTNTDGNMVVAVTESGAVPVWRECVVMASDYYDVIDGTVGVIKAAQLGNPLSTTIATKTSSINFTLTGGPSDDDALNGMTLYVTDDAGDFGSGRVCDYTGSTASVLLCEAMEGHVPLVGETVYVNYLAGEAMAEQIDDQTSQINFNGSLVTAHVSSLAASAITSTVMASNSITSDEIADNAIDAGAIATDAIGAAEIAADAIGASEIATSAIGAAELATGAITTAEFAAGAIDAAAIATDAIGAAEIAASAIGASELATDAIGADELAAGGVDEIWNELAEDQGSTYTAREVLSLLLSEAIGTCVYTEGTRTWVCKDPSDTETRFTLVYGSSLDGDRTSSTPAPVTP